MSGGALEVPRKTAKESNEKVKSDEPNLSGDGAPDRPLREILYFDLDRISSYLSQLKDGLRDYRERIKNEIETENSGGWGAKAGGGVLPISFTANSGNANRLDATTLIERKRDHHAALMLLENTLIQRDVIGDLASGKPFVRHTGNPILIDYPFLARRFNEFEKLQKALQVIADPEGQTNTGSRKSKKTSTTDPRFKHFATVLESGEERLEMYFHDPVVVAPLLRGALLVPAEMVQHLYGSPTRITATLLGLKTTGQTAEVKLEAGTNMAQSTAFMANEYSRLVGKNFRYEADAEHVVPIAIYFEADTVATNI